LDRLDALFAADGASRARAYTLAAAFVRDINRRHGADAAANILRRVGRGDTFERAFAQATGESVSAAEIAFWNGHPFWTAIGPFLTTQTALWMIVTRGIWRLSDGGSSGGAEEEVGRGEPEESRVLEESGELQSRGSREPGESKSRGVVRVAAGQIRGLNPQLC
jgi:hypothetical protein